MKIFDDYIDELFGTVENTIVTNEAGKISLLDGYNSFIGLVKDFRTSQNKLIFIGNGGSAAIASHMAIDYSKAGEINAIALNDPAALTCLSNDYGFEYVFSKQLYYQYRHGDILVAISSSGQSSNIINAVTYLKPFATVFTFSGFKSDNPLRSMGHLNFYVPSDKYGFVELSHMILLHGILDIYNQERKK
jgi:D-sedoheptulose 7-phosphate isomerase